MLQPATLRGYLLEEVLAWLLRGSGYRLLVDESQDPAELKNGANGLRVKGRGADHQVDVLGEFAFTPAFSLPINFVHDPGNRLRKRFRYVYALFSTSGFTEDAQDFALAQQISLVDLSGASFAWLRHSTESAAADLDIFQRRYQIRRFPVRWVRGRLRELLGTAPFSESVEAYPETDARQFAEAAMPVIDRLYETLSERQRAELLLGFPRCSVHPALGHRRYRAVPQIRLRTPRT